MSEQVFEFEQSIGQLEKQRGGYFYIRIDATLVDNWPKGRHTRLRCKLDDRVEYSCGLNHLGDGNYFIIIAKKCLGAIGKVVGDAVTVCLYPDPNPLGVAVPEVLQVLMDQDHVVKEYFEKISDGKKRSLIYSIIKIKNVDLAVAKVYHFIEQSMSG